MTKRMLTAAAACALLAAGAFAQDGEGGSEAGRTLTIGSRAPALDIEHWVKTDEEIARDGGDPGAFRPGRVYVVEFWATWCGPCIASMPHVTGLQRRYADDVTVIGVSNEPLHTVVAFLCREHPEESRLNYDRVGYRLATDPDGSTHAAYFEAAGQTGIPCAFIVGKDGRVEWIGHPMGMDEPLAEVVAGTWDRQTFRARFEEQQRGRERAMRVRTELTEAVRAAEWDKAIGILDRELEKTPDDIMLRMQKFRLLLTGAKRPTEAYLLGYKLVDAAWDDAMVLNDVAWTVVDDESVPERDLEFAMKAAVRANELTKSEDAAILDTLARVHYEKGDLHEALRWQRRAVEQATDERLAKQLRETLEQYEAEAAAKGGEGVRGSAEARLEGRWKIDTDLLQEMEEYKKQVAEMPEGAGSMMADMMGSFEMAFDGGTCTIKPPMEGEKTATYEVKESSADTLTLAMTMDGTTEDVKIRFDGDTLYMGTEGMPFKELPFKRKS